MAAPYKQQDVGFKTQSDCTSLKTTRATHAFSAVRIPDAWCNEGACARVGLAATTATGRRISWQRRAMEI